MQYIYVTHFTYKYVLINSERLPDARRSFSTLFFDSKEQQLTFTDSDGLYDFPSSDGRRSAEPHPHSHRHRSTSSGRHRRKAASSRSPSASKTHAVPLLSEKCQQPQQQQRILPFTSHSHHLDVKTGGQSHGQFAQQRRSPTKRRSMVATHRQRPPAEMSSSSSESIVPRRTPDRSTSGESIS